MSSLLPSCFDLPQSHYLIMRQPGGLPGLFVVLGACRRRIQGSIPAGMARSQDAAGGYLLPPSDGCLDAGSGTDPAGRATIRDRFISP